MDAKRLHFFLDIFVVATIALFVSWYLFDAYTASSHIINLIMVLPLSIIVLILCVAELVNQVRQPKKDFETPESVRDVLPVIGLFTFYIVSLHWLGFDVGTSIFVALFLWLHGERRAHWALGYGITFGFLVALFFSNMLPYPMPMLILPSQY